MNPKEFTEKQEVRVIYDPNGMHIREEDVYGLMQKYADQQLILHDVSKRFSFADFAIGLIAGIFGTIIALAYIL